jgi:hypothetical protein
MDMTATLAQGRDASLIAGFFDHLMPCRKLLLSLSMQQGKDYEAMGHHPC